VQESKVTESLVYVDDFCLQDLGLSVRLSSSEPALPNIRNQSVVVPNRHGAFDYGGWLNAREFTLDCVFDRRESYAELKRAIRKLNALFIDEWGRPKTVKLRFGDNLNVYFNVRLTGGVPMERRANHGIFSLALTAFDPFSYSNVTSDEITWGSEDIYFTATYPLGHNGGNATRKITGNTTFTTYVDGDALRAVMTLAGSASNVTISANGKVAALGAFNNANITIDGEHYTVTKDGVNSLALMTGDFIELLPGDNNITITGSNMNFDLTLRYRDRYV